MEDIDALTRFTPEEKVQFDKEQNLFSLIKTIEFLVSLPYHTTPHHTSA